MGLLALDALLFVAVVSFFAGVYGETVTAMTKADLKSCLDHMETLSPEMKQDALRCLHASSEGEKKYANLYVVVHDTNLYVVVHDSHGWNRLSRNQRFRLLKKIQTVEKGNFWNRFLHEKLKGCAGGNRSRFIAQSQFWPHEMQNQSTKRSY